MEAARHPVGLIGLGRIGTEVARRLIDAGRVVLGYRRGSREEFTRLGGIPAGSVAEIGERCPFVLMALPDEGASESVLEQLGEASETIVVDMTSVTPPAAARLSAAASRRRLAYVEAPISGTPEVIRAYRAGIFVGADPITFARVRELLGLVAPNVVLVGGPGAAAAVKSAALMLIAMNTICAAEALAYAEAFGVDPALAFGALADGPPGSGALQHRGPMMVQRNYPPALGTLEAFRHGLAAIADCAPGPTVMLDRGLAVLGEAIAAGLGSQDIAAIFEMLRSSAYRKA